MTPEHAALLTELEGQERVDGRLPLRTTLERKAAAAIRALAGEVERLNDGTGMTKLAEQRNEAFDERDTLRSEVAEARALQREYRSAQLMAENDAAMVRAVWSDLQPKLEAEIAALEKQVRLAAGMISTTGIFADKHPEAALRFIQDAQAKDDASDERRQFTDGHGNDISHLVDEPPK